ncbi:hypothetical protein KDH_39880 [Dictyobacter sp. S3.2.2.5]|uniref:Uncharacterized protein n=1 Tax=Dictyobacter halimunensis TaxID=3026934 RepID=A0ABQ6FSB5_9CHLR|nr:hypothetical protein KDH_39880 [Dictyobacter sp. S3.2.2.5]
MDITKRIEVERSQEKVFLWMLQPQHIAQLITPDYTKDFTLYTKRPVPPEEVERVARHKRWQEQAETVIEIEDLSTPALQAGTTFRYTMRAKNRSEEFPTSIVMGRNTVTITKSVPFRFFSFRTAKIASALNCRLTFQAQGDRTIIIYHQSYRFSAKVVRRIGGILLSPVIRIDGPTKSEFEEAYQLMAQHRLLQAKDQMEAEIN